MNNQYNVWNMWDPLKTVVLGNSYSPNFFKDIKNDKIRSALTKITEETLEDLEYYEKVLKDFGCTVLRPHVDKNLSILNFANVNSTEYYSFRQGIPRSPLQPRDYQFIIGNKLYLQGLDANGEIAKLLYQYNSKDIINFENFKNRKPDITDKVIKLTKNQYEILKGSSWPTYENYYNNNFENIEQNILDEITSFMINTYDDAGNSTLVGRDLYLDTTGSNKTCNFICETYKEYCQDLRINRLVIEGHHDGCFHTLKPGVIISIEEVKNYEKTFPNWEICYLENQSFHAVSDFLKMKKKVNGKWWVPGEEDNDQFINFVETWLNDWVGYCEESVFDVNVLMLDKYNVCVNNYNETAFAFFKKHKIEPIIVPWRHRYFWDGGLHCITLELYREGVMEDYFPDRTNSITEI
jgi:hypothetical protein